jgi:hypothetical protein
MNCTQFNKYNPLMSIIYSSINGSKIINPISTCPSKSIATDNNLSISQNDTVTFNLDINPRDSTFCSTNSTLSGMIGLVKLS